MSGGMMSSRRPPLRRPTMPWSQPGMTMPAPSWNGERLGAAVPRGVELLPGRPRVADVLHAQLVARLRPSRPCRGRCRGSPARAADRPAEPGSRAWTSCPCRSPARSPRRPPRRRSRSASAWRRTRRRCRTAGSSSSPQAAIPAESTRARVRVISFERIGKRRSCRAGTRTPTTRARIWRAANYTTRQGAAPSIGGLTGFTRRDGFCSLTGALPLVACGLPAGGPGTERTYA